MARRTTFYVMADLFDVPLSPMAKLVLVYLSRCCNRQGICNPSIGTIAYSCNYCRNTVRKAIRELICEIYQILNVNIVTALFSV